MHYQRDLEIRFPSNQTRYPNFHLTYSPNQIETVAELRNLVAQHFYLLPNNFQLFFGQQHLSNDRKSLLELFQKDEKYTIFAVPVLSMTAESEAIMLAQEREIEVSLRLQTIADLEGFVKTWQVHMPGPKDNKNQKP